MTDQQGFFDLLDIMETEKHVEPKRFFDLMRSTFRIANLLYIDIDVLPAGVAVHRLHHTFNGCTVQPQVDDGVLCIDPFLRVAIDCVRPLDWATARRVQARNEPISSDCATLRAAADGITLPLAMPTRRVAFLAIHADVPSDDWPAYRRCHLRDFQLLANLFHASALESDGKSQISDHGVRTLTQREAEVLGWAAAGKSYWEIGTILGISERTVRFFMTNARRKLNVVSNTQAVAQAVRHDLIRTF